MPVKSKKQMATFEEAKLWCSQNGIDSQKKFRALGKLRPDFIPSNLERFYKAQGTWKGSLFGRVANQKREFVSYEEAKEWCEENNITTQLQYREAAKPEWIPSLPERTYKGEWISWTDFLENGRVANQKREFVSYEEAKEWCKENNITTQLQYRDFEKPEFIPGNPERTYKKQGTWEDWGDFLGTDRIANQNVDKFRKSEWLEWIKSMREQLIYLDRIILLDILEQAKISNFLKNIGEFDNLVKAKVGSKEARDTVEKISKQLQASTDQQVADSQESADDSKTNEVIVDVLNNSQEEQKDDTSVDIPTVSSIDELNYYDDDIFSETFSSEETLDFWKRYHENKIWNDIINDKLSFDEISLNKETNTFKRLILKSVLDDYNEIENLILSKDFKKKNDDGSDRYLTMMQKLIAIRFRKTDKIGNWSDTGTGKTLAALYATREHGKNTVIICLNANIKTWTDEIEKYFINSNISYKTDYPNRNNILFTCAEKSHSYLILNVETFQQKNIDIFIHNLIKKNNIDCIIVDEVQSIKTRDDDNVSARTKSIAKLVQACRERNGNFKLMLMSATPIINNFNEPKNLIELMTGQEHSEIDTTLNIKNGLKLFKLLTIYGVRFRQEKKTVVDEIILDIDGSDIDLKKNKIGKGNYLQMEKLLLDHKLKAILPYIIKGETLIYVEYVEGITSKIKKFLNSNGINVAFYTGSNRVNRHETLDKFLRGEVDVLVGSKPITTGINGLQHNVTVMINLIMMWTKADEQQFRGRVIDRKGIDLGKEIKYIVPIVHLKDGETDIEYDNKRLMRIKQKGVLTDMVLDGIIPDGKLPAKEKLLEEVINSLNILENSNGEIIKRKKLKFPLDLTEVEILRRKYGEFSEMNQRWSVCNSSTLSERLTKNSEEWAIYHELYREARSTWSEIPYEVIAEKIKSRPDLIVGDFGCGENLLSKMIENKVFAMDHIAIDDSVLSCDISRTPLSDGQIDCAVFSLSLMGSNYKEYLKEAHRTLKSFGYIIICEPRMKLEEREGGIDNLLKTLSEIGFLCSVDKVTDKFIYILGTKK